MSTIPLYFQLAFSFYKTESIALPKNIVSVCCKAYAHLDKNKLIYNGSKEFNGKHYMKVFLHLNYRYYNKKV